MTDSTSRAFGFAFLLFADLALAAAAWGHVDALAWLMRAHGIAFVASFFLMAPHRRARLSERGYVAASWVFMHTTAWGLVVGMIFLWAYAPALRAA